MAISREIGISPAPSPTNESKPNLMNIRSFIGASSALLLAWLGATYFREVPTDRYPKRDRTSADASGKADDRSGEMIADLRLETQGTR